MEGPKALAVSFPKHRVVRSNLESAGGSALIDDLHGRSRPPHASFTMMKKGLLDGLTLALARTLLNCFRATVLSSKNVPTVRYQCHAWHVIPAPHGRATKQRNLDRWVAVLTSTATHRPNPGVRCKSPRALRCKSAGASTQTPRFFAPMKRSPSARWVMRSTALARCHAGVRRFSMTSRRRCN